MTILDRRVEMLQTLDARIYEARTLESWVHLVQQQHVLRGQLLAEHAAVNRLAQGWGYAPPSSRKPG